MLGIALAVLVGLLLARPIMQGSQEERVRLSRRQLLLAEKEAILAQIRDLDFDHDTGKMPTKIHQHQRAQLMNEAAAILQQLDMLDGNVELTAAGQVDDGAAAAVTIDEEIEAAVTRMRLARTGGAHQGQPGAASGGFCPQCGQPFDAGDKFCVSCGRKLPIKTAVTSS